MQHNLFVVILLGTLASLNNPVLAESEEDKFAPVRDKLNTCVACHGEKGQSKIPTNPILAGQEFFYLYTQLKDFKSGLRENAIMEPIASSMKKDEMQLIAEYFSKQEWPDIDCKAESGDIKTGKQVVNSGQCVACHLGSFKGNSRVPRLAGQHPEYMIKTMLDFKNKVRTNSAAKASLFKTFSDEEISAVGNYLSGFEGE